jgi:hypothetical protein
MNTVDILFPIVGASLRTDHGYALYGAISRVLPDLHGDSVRLRISRINGCYMGNGMMRLEQGRSNLRLRLPAEQIPLVLPLAGKSLTLDEHKIRLGIPQVRALIPAPNLIARMVVMKASSPLRDPGDKASRDRAATKRYLEPAAFLDGVRRELVRRGIQAEADLPLHLAGPRAGQPRRHVLRIRGRAIVGFTVLVQRLTAEESIRLQEEGLGGRGKMGCGFFVPGK